MTDAYHRFVDALQANGRNVIDRGDKATAQCPAHDDNRASLSVGPRNDGNGVVVYCHAGCQTTDILAAIGLPISDLFDDPKMRAAYNGHTVYDYPGGRKVHRDPGKKFWQDGNKSDRTLFHADRIGAAELVYVVEGEKDVLAAESVGAVAVCSAMGAGKANQFDWSPLRGKHVIIVADKDKAGRAHANQIVGLLEGARSVRVAEAAAGKDVGDHVAGGYGLDELVITFDPTAGSPRLWRATDLKPAAQPRWLARDRIPRAAVTLLVGDEGIGKSLLWVWVVAAVTTGNPLPAFGIPAREPSPVIIVITEDAWQDTVLPRLQVAGADLNMIRVICTEEDGSGSPVFPRDVFLIAEADPKAALIVVDAWLDTVSAGLSVRDPQQARQALHPFKEVATKTDAAVLLLCHTNRVTSASARDRYGATGELRKKARMTLYAQADEDGCLLVGPEKMNTARPIPASKFTITSVPHFEPTEDHDGTVPLLSYVGDSELTAREYLAESYAAEHEPGSDDAVGWLANFLAAGPRWSVDVHDAREEADISEKKLRAAKRRLNVASLRAGNDGPWFMALPQHKGREPGVPDAPVSDIWVSDGLGRSEGRTPDVPHGLTKSSPDALSTSQDGLMTNGETRGRLEDDEERQPRLGELCTVCHEQPLWSPQSIHLGVCGACQQKAKGGTT
jgi:5S rRNA maturation endonuclease (ribonuclease M5)